MSRTLQVFFQAALWITGSIALLAYIGYQDHAYFFQSDLLYLPTLYQDFFQTHYSATGWSFTPAPYFFWDMPVYFLIHFFTESITGRIDLAMFFYGILQVFLLVFSVYILSNKETALITFLISCIFLLSTDLLAVLVMPSMHVSASIASLFSLYLYRKKHKVELIVLVSLVVLSDRLFIVWFVFPIIIIELLNRRWKDTLPVVAGTIAGLVFYAIVKNVFRIEKRGSISAFESLKQLSVGLQKLSVEDPFALWLVIPLSLIAWCYLTFIAYNQKEVRTQLHPAYYLAVAAPVVFLSAIITGSYIDLYSSRYWSCLYIFLPVFSFYSITGKTQTYSAQAASFFLLIIAMAIFYYKKNDSNNWLENYNPESVQCINPKTKPLNIISDYWHAREITLFSKNETRAYQIDYFKLIASNTAVNRNWYKDFNRHELEWAIYTENLNTQAITRHYGNPVGKVQCDSGSELWLYGKQSESVARKFLIEYQ